jgi:hypothetical protein
MARRAGRHKIRVRAGGNGDLGPWHADQGNRTDGIAAKENLRHTLRARPGVARRIAAILSGSAGWR